MSFTASAIDEALWAFAAISLSELNECAQMLKRIDNKYVVTGDVVKHLLLAMTGKFDILDIAGQRRFNYDTFYFDDALRQSYLDHHQGRRNRAKVRIRNYVAANESFIEIKLKDRRGATVKKRMVCAASDHLQLDPDALRFVEKAYRDHYGLEFPHALTRALDVSYSRIALVAKSAPERITIDANIAFRNAGRGFDVGPARFIIETKSRDGHGLADRILRELHQRPVRSCSKYCLGTVLLHRDLRHNRFRPALRKLVPDF